MGRELRRVPLDFDWPLNKIWEGYINPHIVHDCPQCGGRGEPPSSYWLSRWIDLLLLAADESVLNTRENKARFRETGRRYPHPYLLANDGINVKSADDLGDGLWAVVEGLVGEKLKPSFGGLAATSTTWRVLKRLLGAAGMSEEEIDTWVTCQACKGAGFHAEDPEAYETWESYNPPDGPGYQLWETTSEGSPISPVFESLDELCEWAAENATTFGKFTASAAEWKSMLERDFVCHREGNLLFI